MLEQRYSFYKRKTLINKEERILSIIKAIIILNLIENKNIKLVLLIIKNNLEILIPRTYKEVINNPNYS